MATSTSLDSIRAARRLVRDAGRRQRLLLLDVLEYRYWAAVSAFDRPSRDVPLERREDLIIAVEAGNLAYSPKYDRAEPWLRRFTLTGSIAPPAAKAEGWRQVRWHALLAALSTRWHANAISPHLTAARIEYAVQVAISALAQAPPAREHLELAQRAIGYLDSSSIAAETVRGMLRFRLLRALNRLFNARDSASAGAEKRAIATILAQARRISDRFQR